VDLKAATETQLVKALLQRLAWVKGVTAWRNNTTGVYDPVRKRFRRFTGRKGVSDILGQVTMHVVCDCGAAPVTFGRLLAVEAKLPGKKPTAEQRRFLEEIRDGGGIGILAYCVGDLEAGLRAAGVRL
jgi:hypothetical protein